MTKQMKTASISILKSSTCKALSGTGGQFEAGVNKDTPPLGTFSKNI